MRQKILQARNWFKTIALSILLAVMSQASPAVAQNLFAIVAKVNGNVVTQYELSQRMALMDALQPGTGDRDLALDILIDERLQMAEATANGIAVSSKDLLLGVNELAERMSLSPEDFTAYIGKSGVSPESLRDFIAVGLAWRDLIRLRYGAKAGTTQAEVDRAITFAGTNSSLRVLISEIFLPTHTEEFANISNELAPQIAALRTIPEFSDAARQFSAGASRGRGGRVEDWIPVANLPAALQPLIMEMSPGDVTPPIEIPNALALFQLRAVQEFAATAATNPRVDYVELAMSAPSGADLAAKAATLGNRVDSCDDLYGVLSDAEKAVMSRSNTGLKSVATDIALALAKLDPGEHALLQAPGGNAGRFVMLCARQNDGGQAPEAEAFKIRLSNQKLNQYAIQHLAALRTQAKITRK